MKSVALFGLLVLLPVAVGPVSAPRVLTVLVCSGDGIPRRLVLPAGEGPAQRGDERQCVKGCHGANTRKRSVICAKIPKP